MDAVPNMGLVSSNRAANQEFMSPQQREREQARGLFSGKVHFRMPSAEATFAFPNEVRLDSEDIAAAVVLKKENEQQA